MRNSSDLAGKRILLAGKSGNLIEEILLKVIEEGGEPVLLSDTGEIRNRYFNKDLPVIQIDFSNQAGVESDLLRFINDSDPFDGFVYCYTKSCIRPLNLTNIKILNEIMFSNFFLFVETVRQLIKKRKLKNSSSIVAISSVSSSRGLKGKLAYSASKAALDSSVRSLAAELGEKKIRVNSINKGWLEEDFNNPKIKDNLEVSESNDLNKQILGPIAESEIGSMVCFLLGDSSRSITGTNILLDGGYSL